MASITKPNTFVTGATIQAAEHNSNFDTIYNDYNGNITNANLSASAAVANSKLNLTSIAQAVGFAGGATMSASDLDEAKGADVASAATTTIWVTDGNFIHITGTVTITSFGTASQAGAERVVVFDGALTLTHNATSLILPTGANITTAAGDVAFVRAETTANARVVAFYRKDGSSLLAATAANSLSGSVIQTVITTSTTAASLGTTALPIDNTIPQNTEGSAISALDTAITPNNASNKLVIIANVHLCKSGAAGGAALALFQDSTANALEAACWYGNDTPYVTVQLVYTMTAGTTSATTFKLRTGDTGGSTIWINGQANTGARLFGGIAVSKMIIQEIKA